MTLVWAARAPLSLQTELAQRQTALAQGRKAQTEQQQAGLNLGLQYLQGATPQNYPAIRAQVQQVAPHLAPLLPARSGAEAGAPPAAPGHGVY